MFSRFVIKVLFAILFFVSFDAFAANVRLNWSANSELDISGYKIYYGTSSGNYTSTVNVGNLTTYNVTSLSAGQTYYFVLTAYNSSGLESNYSSEISINISSSPTPTPTPIITPTPTPVIIPTPIPTPPPSSRLPGTGIVAPDSDTDGLSDSREISLGTNPFDADTDDDGVQDGQEITDGTNPLDAGSNYPQLSNFFCNEWNSHVSGSKSLIELNNRGLSSVNAQLLFYNSSGNLIDIKNFSISTGTQIRTNIFDYSSSEYRLAKICVLHNGGAGDIEGQIISYKQSGGSYQYAFATPFSRGVFGKQYVRYNNRSNSTNSKEKKLPVENIIQLYNNSNSTITGKLNFFNDQGTFIRERSVTLSYYQRYDFNIDQFGANSNYSGHVEWVPDSQNIPVVMRSIVRYFDNAKRSESYISGINYGGSAGTSDNMVIPYETSLVADSCITIKKAKKGRIKKVKRKNCKKSEISLQAILEVTNSLYEGNNISVDIYAQDGEFLNTVKLSLNAHETKEISVKDIVGYNKNGVIVVRGEKLSSTIASLRQFNKDIDGKIISSFVIPGKISIGSVLQGGYDLTEGQDSELVLINSSEYQQTVNLEIRTSDGTVLAQGIEFSITAKARLDIDLRDYSSGTQDGIVVVQPNVQNTIAAWVFKERNKEFLVPTVVR